jgi:hypothetical protein
MKSMFLAAAAVLSLGIGSAYAGDGDGPVADTYFTELPGVVAQPAVQQAPRAVATNANGASANLFATRHSTGTWLFPPDMNGGGDH